MTLPIQLISTDFDGTLHADFESPPVPHDLQNLIGTMQQQGAKWVINTGRDLSSVMEGMARARLTIKPDFLVVVERDIYVHENAQYEASATWNTGCRAAHDELFERVRKDVPKLTDWVSKRYRASLYEDAFSPFCLIAENNADAAAETFGSFRAAAGIQTTSPEEASRTSATPSNEERPSSPSHPPAAASGSAELASAPKRATSSF